MVIERALEKLRQSQQGAGGAARGDSGRSRSSRPAQASASKPVFEQLSVDNGAAEVNRIMLPDVSVGDDAQAAAAYRIVRTRLMQKLRTNQWRSLAITSPGAGEGKSLTALNLAMSMARDASSEVFLLDLDMRHPSLCRYVGTSPPRELTKYLAGEGAPADVLFALGPIKNLSLAGSVYPSEQASELISSPRLEELLTYIYGIATNPIVLIDLPPILVTDEALLMAPRVDATLLVVGEGRTRRDSLARARQMLAEFAFAGVLLNCSSETFGADSYYGYGTNYAENKV